MILLDTNVVSEPMKPKPERAVIEWLNRQDPDTLYLASTSLAELLLGVEILPAGKRKDAFQSALTTLVSHFFGPRILSFDANTASNFASLVANARFAGKAISMADGQIAAIAATHGFMIASRDATPFLAAGLKVIDPWTAD